jgi:hypothetical protein
MAAVSDREAARLRVRAWLRQQIKLALKPVTKAKIRMRDGDGRQIVIPPPRPR